MLNQSIILSLPPLILSRHTLTLTPDGRLLMFGGCTLLTDASVPKYLNDLRQLHTATMSWSLLRTDGDVPTARCGHSAVLVGGGAFICYFGGWGMGGNQCEESTHDPHARSIHLLEVSSLKWDYSRCLDKKTPKHLYYHNACSLAEGMLLYGGFDGRQASNVLGILAFVEKNK